MSYEPDDTRYVSDVTVDWPKISKAMQLVAGAEHGGGARVALLNFDDGEVQQWRTALPQTAAAVARLERAGSNVTWEHLYPEWIDEEELYHAPTCPDLPEPAVDADGDGEEVAVFDVVAVKLPCRRGVAGPGRGPAAPAARRARLAATRGRGGAAAHVLVVSASRCFPIPNLFRCRDEVAPRDATCGCTGRTPTRSAGISPSRRLLQARHAVQRAGGAARRGGVGAPPRRRRTRRSSTRRSCTRAAR